MGAQENLERMLKLIEEREAKGEFVLTPSEVAAQERKRYDGVKFPGVSGEFEPPRNHRLKRQMPYTPGRYRPLTELKHKVAGKKGKKRKPGSRSWTQKQKADQRWKDLKAQVIAERGEVCQCCNGKTNLLWLSHRNWLRKGKELPEDVELLCKDCFSAKFEGKATMVDEFSKEYRAILKTGDKRKEPPTLL